MVDIIRYKSKVSLRVLDWFITKYSKKKMDSTIDSKEMFNINVLYKAQLKSYKKKNFDPFRRRARFYFSYDKTDKRKKIQTTLGQLNFFRWAITHKIIDYVEKNLTHIRKCMNLSNKEEKKKKTNKKKTIEIEKKTIKKIKEQVENISNKNITLRFD